MITLNNYNKYCDLNKGTNFSVFDYIFHVIQMNNISTDIYFSFTEFFQPSFVVYKDYIFLKELFSEEKANDLIEKKAEVEYWMNIFLLDSYFQDDEDGDDRAIKLTSCLRELWQLKLEKEFPDKNIVVHSFFDEETGDCGLSFYQKKYEPKGF